MGKITLSVNTKGYQGNIHKTAKVYTNDSRIRHLRLGVRAFVQVPINVSQRHVRLYGREDVSVTTSIIIKAGLDKALTLEPGQFSLEGKLTYKIEEIDNGRKFKIHFTSIPGFTGPFRGFLKLKTNYDEKPIVTIGIAGRLRKLKRPKE